MPPRKQQPAPDQPQYLTKVEAADYIRCSVRSLDRMKQIPKIRRGGRILYRRASLDAAMLALESDSK
jgi:hypothetical protein